MSRKKNARPAVGAVERAEAGKVLEDIHSQFHCTPKTEAGQIQISDFLGRGMENAVPRRHLELVTGLDGRKIRLEIERARRSGTLILSDCRKGYFLAADEAEAQAFTRSMRKRAGEIIKTASAIERAAGIG